MNALKRNWLLIVLALVLISALATVVVRCSRSHAATVPASNNRGLNSVAPGSSPPAATPTLLDSLLDPTTLGAIITAIASGLGLLWKALKAKDVHGAIAAVSASAKTYETIRDSLAQGVPLIPSVETLAADITASSRNSDGPVASEARAIAIKLLEKYTITVRP